MQSYQPLKDLRILLISSKQLHLLTYTPILEYFGATESSPVPVYAWDPIDLVNNAGELALMLTSCFLTLRSPWISHPAKLTLRDTFHVRTKSVVVVCEETCGSELFQRAAREICGGDFWRQSMSEIIFRKRAQIAPTGGFVQIDTGFPELVQVPLYTHAEHLRMATTPPTRECLTSVLAQRWGRPSIDLSQGILWYKPTMNEAGDITRLGWQNLPDNPVFEAKRAMVGSAS